MPWKRIQFRRIRDPQHWKNKEHLEPAEASRTHFDQTGSIEDESGEGLEEILPFLFFMWKQICVLLHVTILVAF
jgi:hypothetical protein